MLARKGLVNLRVKRSKEFQAGILANPRMMVSIEDRIKLVYDTFDGTTLSEEMLGTCDFYFKRSYDPVQHHRHPLAARIHPLGLNYSVYTRGDFSWRRCFWSWLVDNSPSHRAAALVTARNSRLLSRLFLNTNGRSTCDLEHLEGRPFLSADPIILFMSRTWNPEKQETQEGKLEREHMNETRANCVRKLRKGFGARFIGGLEPTDYARKHFADCVVDARLTRKKTYLEAAKRASICISTIGLLQSNPWKLGEYAALAKAIVSEPLAHAVPGDFGPNRNYLEFRNPDECVEQATRLATDSQLRYEMMLQNYAYYHAFLRPDMLIWNTLQTLIPMTEAKQNVPDLTQPGFSLRREVHA